MDEKFSKNSSLYSNKNRNYILLLPYHIKISRDLHIFFFFVFGWVMLLTAICHVFAIWALSYSTTSRLMWVNFSCSSRKRRFIGWNFFSYEKTIYLKKFQKTLTPSTIKKQTTESLNQIILHPYGGSFFIKVNNKYPQKRSSSLLNFVGPVFFWKPWVACFVCVCTLASHFFPLA